MKILRTVIHAQKQTTSLRRKNKVIGFVPTMGFLHEGHLSLIKRAKRNADIVIVSIFINPFQFGPNEDFRKYPRDFKRDEKLCKEAGVDYLFYPSAEELYPKGFSTFIEVKNITTILEGKIRPGHFTGVATVVLKLFNIIQPHFSVFGQKDAQQVCVIKKMRDDLNFNTEILINPTIREKNGLAMSSRNVYLNVSQKKDAAILYECLKFARDNFSRLGVKQLVNTMKKFILSKPTVTGIDYISVNRNNDLMPVTTRAGISHKTEILVSLAVRFGKVRLIDNIVFTY